MKSMPLVLPLSVLLIILTSMPGAAQSSDDYSLVRSDASVSRGTLAIIAGTELGVGDLDANVRQAIEGLTENERAERGRLVEEQTALALFGLEAKAQRVGVQQLLANYVRPRVKEPTDAEIQEVFNLNQATLAGASLASMRPQIVAFIKNERAQDLLGAYSKTLRTKYKVAPGVDINAPEIKPSSVLVTIAGTPMLAGPILERLKASIYEMRDQVYRAASAEVERIVYSKLILLEAQKRKVEPEELIRAEVTNKGSTQEEQQRLEAELNERLARAAGVRFFLNEPPVPTLKILSVSAPAQGEANAAVTVVMFTDFQCPSCAATHPVVLEVMKNYVGRARLVVRYFPLDMHKDARKAAEAAAAANAQGKFFEYIEILYKNQQALDIPALKKYATQIGLNRVKFDAALARGTYAGLVQRDVDEGGGYGIRATPTIFVNGVKVRDLKAETIDNAIARALELKSGAANH